jgi:hypothetical protein
MTRTDGDGVQQDGPMRRAPGDRTDDPSGHPGGERSRFVVAGVGACALGAAGQLAGLGWLAASGPATSPVGARALVLGGLAFVVLGVLVAVGGPLAAGRLRVPVQLAGPLAAAAAVVGAVALGNAALFGGSAPHEARRTSPPTTASPSAAEAPRPPAPTTTLPAGVTTTVSLGEQIRAQGRGSNFPPPEVPGLTTGEAPAGAVATTIPGG